MAVRMDPQTLRDAVEARLPGAQKLLCDLVALPSPPGEERAVLEVAEQAFAPLAEVRRVEMGNDIKQDKDYQDYLPDLDYAGRYNLHVTFQPPAAWRGRKGPAGKSLLLNAHLDAVPPSEGQKSPFAPELRKGAIYGRGACDAKGQVATAYLAMAALRDLGVDLAGEFVAHLVVEEELGGNGTLAMIRSCEKEKSHRRGARNADRPATAAANSQPGHRADACVVLEPTDLKVLTSSRGAVWFRIALKGKPGHSGQAGFTRNAIDMAFRVTEILRGYHKRLLEASRGDPLFDRHPNPMPLTIGSLHAGNWPAIAPGEAILQGVLGLLPNRTAKQVMHEMTSLLAHEGGDLLAGNFDIHFTYRHDASVLAVDHPLVAALQSAARSMGVKAPVEAMTASCDACFYTNRLRVPAVVFGGGSLSVAHSNTEHMPLSDLAAAAEVIAGLAVNWCGSA